MARHLISTSLIFAVAATLSASALAQNVATVNGKTIPKSRVDQIVNELKQNGQQDSPALRKMITDKLIEREILLQEAQRRGLAKKPEVKTQMDMTREMVLIQALQQDLLKDPVPEAELKAAYERIKGQLGDKEYHARHILVKEEAAAKDLIEQLKKGAKFADLVKHSIEPGADKSGGDLNWARPSQFVQPFAEALTKLEKEKFTEAPVQTEFGWHVIYLEDVRAAEPPKYEEVKDQLVQTLQQQRAEKTFSDLMKNAKVNK